jgi:hypothetical protein
VDVHILSVGHYISAYAHLHNNKSVAMSAWREEAVRLVPHFVLQAVYWLYYIPSTQPSALALALKCAPILALIAYVAQHQRLDQCGRVPRLVLYGLVFSVLGDGLLVYDDLFPLGMLAFGTAHVFFISALGWAPLKPGVAVPLVLFAVAYLSQVFPLVPADPVLRFGIPIYAALLLTTAWRAIARMDGSLLRALAAAGAVAFVVSDGSLALNMFYEPWKNTLQSIVMSTYYGAQFGLTMVATEAFVQGEKKQKK